MHTISDLLLVDDKREATNPAGGTAVRTPARPRTGRVQVESLRIHRRGDILYSLHSCVNVLHDFVPASYNNHCFGAIAHRRQTVSQAVDIDELAVFGDRVGATDEIGGMRTLLAELELLGPGPLAAVLVEKPVLALPENVKEAYPLRCPRAAETDRGPLLYERHGFLEGLSPVSRHIGPYAVSLKGLPGVLHSSQPVPVSLIHCSQFLSRLQSFRCEGAVPHEDFAFHHNTNHPALNFPT